MKKRLSLLLALLLLAGAAAGCSESNPETPASEAGQTGAAVPSAEAEEVPVETEYVEPFEAEVTDQGGRTVNIFMAGLSLLVTTNGGTPTCLAISLSGIFPLSSLTFMSCPNCLLIRLRITCGAVLREQRSI